MVEAAGPCVWIGLLRAEHRIAGARPGAARPALPGHRGCRQSASASKDRTIRQRAVCRRPHRADRSTAAIGVRRNASIRRRGLCGVACATAPRAPTRSVREHCESCPTTLSNGADYILYAILDFIVDNYMPVIDTIQAEVEPSRTACFPSRLRASTCDRLYMLRRELLRLRNAAVPLVEVCRRLEHAEVGGDRRQHAADVSRDVTDHLLRVAGGNRHACAKCWLSPSRPT